MGKLLLPKLDGPRIFCDFNVWDEPGRFTLGGSGTISDLEKYGIQLREGMILTLYMLDADAYGNRDDLLAIGVVHWNADKSQWEADVNSATMLQESVIRKMHR